MKFRQRLVWVLALAGGMLMVGGSARAEHGSSVPPRGRAYGYWRNHARGRYNHSAYWSRRTARDEEHDYHHERLNRAHRRAHRHGFDSRRDHRRWHGRAERHHDRDHHEIYGHHADEY
ncbi:MAG: hypothetical protein HY320_10105 [Armatimonadetes bacterium]|nr:hypothetical protein [Armatimonadota bacterium]